jgi:hypothetical protein
MVVLAQSHLTVVGVGGVVALLHVFEVYPSLQIITHHDSHNHKRSLELSHLNTYIQTEEKNHSQSQNQKI